MTDPRSSPERVLVVVARDQEPLLEYLRWGFAGVRGVEIILDRRLGDRRRPPGGGVARAEQRRRERRRAQSRAELRARGFAIVNPARARRREAKGAS